MRTKTPGKRRPQIDFQAPTLNTISEPIDIISTVCESHDNILQPQVNSNDKTMLLEPFSQETICPMDPKKNRSRRIILRAKQRTSLENYTYRMHALQHNTSQLHLPEKETSYLVGDLTTGTALSEDSQTSKTVKKRKRSSISGIQARTGRDVLSVILESPNVLVHQPDCPYCGAIKIVYETANFCCSSGDIYLASDALPELFKELLFSYTEEAKTFKTYIRAYNNHLAFTSFGVKYDKDLARRNKGIYTFRVQGQVYHFINQLVEKDAPFKNLQFYFHDTEYEIKNRLETCPVLSEVVLKQILNVIELNPYVTFFRSLRTQPDLEMYKIVLFANPTVDQRVYNKPTVSQVSALWVEGEENGETGHRHIQVYTHDGGSRNIEYYYGCYDPLQYPLMFPFGQLGWHQGILKKGLRNTKKNKKNESAKDMISPTKAIDVDNLLDMEAKVMTDGNDNEDFVSVREYYCYKLQIRPNDESYILNFGRLTQQYLVDMFIKLETQRLDYYRLQQDDCRKECLQGIVDAYSSGETSANKIGQRIVLPASFIGGPRHMRRKYIDAMALVQKFGKPDIFLTITCNPNWPEIKEYLLPGEHIQDRPDLAVRIFHAKVEELKKDIFKNHIFGEVAAYTYVIEFQKRGLPHAHFLLILKSQFKLFRPEEYDKIVSAEIPNKDETPHLHNMVKKHMMHGPCGKYNANNVCMKKDGRCRNSYPKDFSEETTQTSDAYPKYRRRNNGTKEMVRGSYLDNRWVVPYNPYLLTKFDCHINVEICSTVKAIKYIYKYICKGNDKILFHVSGEASDFLVDEIKDYVSARWISPPEAAWRIFRFHLGEMKPAVIHLQLHLENYQPITFKKKQTLRNIVNNTYQRKTMLTQFFFMNKTDKDAQKLNCTYQEFPDHFVWIANQRYWKLRKRGDSIGRIVMAHPSEGERYYLRLLLTKIRCPTSFEHLRTHNNILLPSFHAAALCHGFLQDDNYQDVCLQEACLFHMPYEMRRLFATLLVYSPPSDPKALLLKYESYMTEDMFRYSVMSPIVARKKLIHEIQKFLLSMGRSIEAFDLDIHSVGSFELEDMTRELRAEKSIVVSDNDLQLLAKLNTEQRLAFDTIFQCVHENKGGAFFVDGPGGTGKTFLYRALLAKIRSNGHIALATATSGIAASILPGGRTAHSRFKIPIDIADGSTCRVSKQSSLAFLIKECKLILWDEAPMAKKCAIEALDDLLQDLMESTIIFGGKVVVLGGDFRQTLPVVRRGTKNETISASLINSPLWLKLQKLPLTENMRSCTDPFFTDYVLRVGNGYEPSDDNENIRIHESILLTRDLHKENLSHLIDTVYPDIENSNLCLLSTLNRAILTTKNQFVDEINNLVIDKFPGNEVEYLSFDETLNPADQGQYVDILNSLTPNGLPPHKLVLKINCPIILLRNIDPSEGLCNGTRLICKSLQRNVIHAEISVGDFAGKSVFIHRIPLFPPSDDSYPVPYKRVQFPVRLCFAMTINKAQGQTLDYVGIYLKEPVFSHGQLYVALSRARSSSCVKVLIQPTFFDNDTLSLTKNIVYRDLLQSMHAV